uniref:Uncharacterized protein n=1 Tax=Octopus bimaculoides TaxID=37653 RepID=A0A0L8IAB5_OCTBM
MELLTMNFRRYFELHVNLTATVIKEYPQQI